MTEEITGPYGKARRVPPHSFPPPTAHVDAWILTAEIWHPNWSQYLITLITLADVPGMPEAEKVRPEFTHQLTVITLNPDHGPYKAEDCRDDYFRFLLPPNVEVQFTATDEQAIDLCRLCARATTDGILEPEATNGHERIRAAWALAVRQTLEHQRDPFHGTMN